MTERQMTNGNVTPDPQIGESGMARRMRPRLLDVLCVGAELSKLCDPDVESQLRRLHRRIFLRTIEGRL